jgi:diguanylate cyclase (GGDEF)-like protein
MRSEVGVAYLEASADGQIDKVLGDLSWLPFAVKPFVSTVEDVLPVLVGAPPQGRLELDFVELGDNSFVDILYQADSGRQSIWLRDARRPAAHLRAAQQVANTGALNDAVTTQWSDELRRERSHIRILIDQLPVAIAYWDLEGRLIYANTAFAQLSNSNLSEMLDHDMSDPVIANVGPPAPLFRDSPSTSTRTFERALSRNGISFWYDAQLIPDLSPAGDVVGYIDVSIDKTGYRRAEDRAHRLALVDTLTNLPNRRAFEEVLSDRIAAAKQSSGTFWLAFVDLVGFKAINDTSGHLAGDVALTELAQRLRAALPESYVARIGGDAFAFCATSHQAGHEPAYFAERAATAMQTPLSVGGAAYSVEVSVGIAWYPKDGEDTTSLLRRADQRLMRVGARPEGDR